MRCLLALLIAISTTQIARSDDADQIKALIPVAVAMKKAEFAALATSPNPQPSMLKEISLSTELLTTTFTKETTEAEFDEFTTVQADARVPTLL